MLEVRETWAGLKGETAKQLCQLESHLHRAGELASFHAIHCGTEEPTVHQLLLLLTVWQATIDVQ